MSAEGWPVDDFDVHDQVVDHIEDEHSRPVQAEPDVSVAGAVGAVRWRLREVALAEGVAAVTLQEDSEVGNLPRQVVLVWFAERAGKFRCESRPSVADQCGFFVRHRLRR